jgi:hypothetical protein
MEEIKVNGNINGNILDGNILDGNILDGDILELLSVCDKKKKIETSFKK